MTEQNQQPIKEEVIEIKSVKPNWLDDELKSINKYDGDSLPALKFPENELIEIDIDFSTPFNKYNDEVNQCVKKIVPVTYKGEKFNWWLNVSNPIYHKILEAGKTGLTHFKILRTGQMKNTRFSLVK